MKILYVCKTLPYAFKGGIQTHIWKLSEFMIQLGHEVSILTSGSLKKGMKTRNENGRKIIELPYFPGRYLPKIGVLAEEWSFNKSAAKWLEKNQTQFDIIHLQGRSGNLFLKHPEKVKVPVVNTLHGFIHIEHERRGDLKNLSKTQKWYLNWANKMEEKALQNADALITVSQEMTNALKNRLPECLSKTVIIPNGIDVPNRLPDTLTNENLLLFIGRLDAIKGIFPLVEAMKKTKENIRLVMVGDGPARSELEKAIKEAGLQNRILLKGSLDSSQVFKWIGLSYALILPSFHETQGIVLMEANSCAKPVLASDINGINEVVMQGKNGLLFDKNNPQKMANAINYLFDNPYDAASMGEWGREFVKENFSWYKIAKRTENIYKTITKNSLSPAKTIQKNV